MAKKKPPSEAQAAFDLEDAQMRLDRLHQAQLRVDRAREALLTAKRAWNRAKTELTHAEWDVSLYLRIERDRRSCEQFAKEQEKENS